MSVLQGLSIAIIGNFAPRGSGVFYQGEVLAGYFAAEGARTLSISHVQNRYVRPISTVLGLLWNARRYDVLCIQAFSYPNWINAACAVGVGRMLRKRVTMVYRGGGFREFASRMPWAVLPVLRRVDALVVPSGFLDLEFQKHSIPHRTIPNLIELQGWPYRRRVRPSPRLLWVRHLRSGYNPWMAIEVLERVRRRFPGATLRMAGDGHLRSEMLRRIAEGRIPGVEILGHLPLEDLMRHYSESDIFINTTNIDNQPRSVMEAMACGLPVVSTNVGGIPYLITDQVNGLLVPPRDPDSMASAVLALIDRPDLALRLADSAIEMVRSFSWSSNRSAWVEVLTGGIPMADRPPKYSASA
jgi:L-malate glycosyltransferase